MLYCLLAIAAVALVGVGVGFCIAFHRSGDSNSTYSYGAITSNGEGCADLGRLVFKLLTV